MQTADTEAAQPANAASGRNAAASFFPFGCAGATHPKRVVGAYDDGEEIRTLHTHLKANTTMKNEILRATLLAMAASASFTLTQVAGQAATAVSPAAMTSARVCAVAPAGAPAHDALAAPSLNDNQPEHADPFMLRGGH